MKMLRSAAAVALARMVYEQARKPENQAKLRAAMERARQATQNRPR
jgi:PHD/YefM family antitoxin component YafN of YafNO toxin-antitoxin module